MKDETLNRNDNIYENYLERAKDVVQTERNQDKAIIFLSKKFGIGVHYIRNILKDKGVMMERKQTYNRKDKTLLKIRNADIIKKYKDDGLTPEQISESYDYNIGAARIRQILKQEFTKQEGVDYKTEKEKTELCEVGTTLELVKKDINEGMSHHDILDKYNHDMLNKIKTKLEYNIFGACLDVRNARVVSLFYNKTLPCSCEYFITEEQEKLYLEFTPVERKTWIDAGKDKFDKNGHLTQKGKDWPVIKRPMLFRMYTHTICPQGIGNTIGIVKDYIYGILGEWKKGKNKPANRSMESLTKWWETHRNNKK